MLRIPADQSLLHLIVHTDFMTGVPWNNSINIMMWWCIMLRISFPVWHPDVHNINAHAFESLICCSWTCCASCLTEINASTSRMRHAVHDEAWGALSDILNNRKSYSYFNFKCQLSQTPTCQLCYILSARLHHESGCDLTWLSTPWGCIPPAVPLSRNLPLLGQLYTRTNVD